MTTLALIAGQGDLPQTLLGALPARPLVCALAGFQPEIAVDVTFRVERLVPFLRDLGDRGITQVVFAGAVQRPRLDPALFDAATAQLVPRLLAALQSGDDATLKVVIALFEEGGFTVIGVPDVAPALLPKAGLLAGQTGPRDADDAARAGIIARALGAVDVGQGVCVAQGLCLAVEALPGTDAMLTSLADLPPGLRPDPRLGRGLYYKAAKPGQDLRIDLPTIGPRTLELVAKAGLGGIVIEAGKVICLDLDQMLRQAALLDLFLWSRPCPASS